MSQWFDSSNNANKFRQSYVKGFLDISGGGVYIRSDNSLNLYTTADGVNPGFSMKATEYRVRDSGTNYDVSINKLRYLVDLDENVQSRLDDLVSRTANLGAGSFTSDLSLNAGLSVATDANFDAKVVIDGDVSLNSKVTMADVVTLKSDLVVEGDVDISGSLDMLTNINITSSTTGNNSSIAVGYNAASTSQSTKSIAIGSNAGRFNQDSMSVSVGSSAGQNNQGNNSVAVGPNAGMKFQK